MKELVVKLVEKALKKHKIKLKKEEIEKFIEVPKNPDMGDFAFPCFVLVKDFKLDPHEIALQLRQAIGNPPATDFEKSENATL